MTKSIRITAFQSSRIFKDSGLKKVQTEALKWLWNTDPTKCPPPLMIMQGSKRKIAMRWISRTCGCHKMPSSTRRTAHFHWMGVCCNYSIVANFGNHSASSIKILSQSRKQYKRCGSWPTWYFRCLNNFWDLNATSSYPSKYLIICNMRVVIVVHSKTIWYSWYMLIYVDICWYTSDIQFDAPSIALHGTFHGSDESTHLTVGKLPHEELSQWCGGAAVKLWRWDVIDGCESWGYWVSRRETEWHEWHEW